jgi:K+-dependent Na+/Ca+ exchanger-like protein
MTKEQREKGGVVFHIFMSIYIFCALAIICDDYFVSSLEHICNALGMQADVAGATFMAAGSSAPELFTSVVGVFFAKSDVGIGTIVGSALFNILFIIAMCALGAGMIVYLTWWPMFRDCLYYMLAVGVLVAVVADQQVQWYEGMVMVILYCFYIVLMYFNPRLSEAAIAWSTRKGWFVHTKDPDAPETKAEKKANAAIDARANTAMLEMGNPHHLSQLDKIRTESFRHRSGSIRTEEGRSRGNTQKSVASSVEAEEPYESPLTFPDDLKGRIWWVFMLPVTLACMVTIPDCRRPGCWQKTFMLTFIMSIAWIALLSYLMVWMVCVAGDTMRIPDTVMGLTILAAGTSVPDALSSLFVARDGYGDMAVANSIGSNVFDILLCLGLPWMLQTTAVDWGSYVEINSNSLTFIAVTLFGTVVFLFGAMLIVGWKLNKKVGVLCIIVYVVVILFACLFEMNVFSDINPPLCPYSPEFI